jgi:hypothetical protein
VPAAHESAAWITRTAMCAEPRDGVLYVFMPPTERAEDYLQLVAAVEATAQALGQPVMLEGYEPPRDPRLNNFRITPDPGVIEANIHPAHDWAELVERTTFLYQAARELRLGTEKFMLDGRHTGTGGGNHFVLGGATPRTRRSCAGRTCWRACWPTGTTIRRCRTCFRACSSVRRRRRRGWTRRATTRCTNWSWRSSSCRRRAARCRRGSPTGCCATC